MKKLTYYSFIISITAGFVVGWYFSFQMGVIWLLSIMALVMVTIYDKNYS